MIAAELAQRGFVQLKKNLAEFFGFRVTGCEALPVNLAQGADKTVAVFVADFAIRVAMAIAETCLAHGLLHCADSQRASPRCHQMATLRRNRSPPTEAAKVLVSGCEGCSVRFFEEMIFMKKSKSKKVLPEVKCTACNGTGFPKAKQPAEPGHRFYPAPCEKCAGKGRLTRHNPVDSGEDSAVPAKSI